ncbi:MAG: transposase [Gammaproteobacteria bacterium]|nr:transposase [Gammaproteobacteria bacterium]MBU1655552.1 transposase [Gammaproteobacteria bacterium]MBU1960249.1 transposase [Gammaproteobacteria bacterium]
MRHNLKTVRSYLLKEEFQRFWESVSLAAAADFLDEWAVYAHARRMRIAVAYHIQRHPTGAVA